MYTLYGRICAYSLIHGGPPPSMFSKSAYEVICFAESAVEGDIGDIPDPDLQQSLTEVTVARQMLTLSSPGALGEGDQCFPAELYGKHIK